jgi:putative membrane protein insertion efficiency factor
MKYLLMGLIRLYQIALSPLVNWRGSVCKYYPSCSHYGYEAVRTYGAFKGGGMTVWRVLRCNPWSAGGYDPVRPEHSHEARNLSDPETSSPGEPQTSDRLPEVGSANGGNKHCQSELGHEVAGPDLTSNRGA